MTLPQRYPGNCLAGSCWARGCGPGRSGGSRRYRIDCPGPSVRPSVFQVLRHTAMSNASRASSSERLALIDQPTTLRANRSTTSVRYSQPCHVRMRPRSPRLGQWTSCTASLPPRRSARWAVQRSDKTSFHSENIAACPCSRPSSSINCQTMAFSIQKRRPLFEIRTPL